MEPTNLTRKNLRIAAAKLDVAEATAARALAGFPTREPNLRARLLMVLEELGVQREDVPPPNVVRLL